MHPKQADPELILRHLEDAGVEGVVIGGVAAVLHGAPVPTYDVDIVHRREVANVARLAVAVAGLDAYIREPQPRFLRPTEALLGGRGQVRLSTRFGPLDLLGTIHDGRGYDELRPLSIPLQGSYTGLTMLDLQSLIDIKGSTGRAKDRMMVPILLSILRRGRDDG